MAQFDVHRFRSGPGLIVNCQSDALHPSNRRFMIPLLPIGEIARQLPRLTPRFVIEDDEYVMATLLAASVPVNEIGARVTSLAEHRDEIVAAIDMLITGY